MIIGVQSPSHSGKNSNMLKEAVPIIVAAMRTHTILPNLLNINPIKGLESPINGGIDNILPPKTELILYFFTNKVRIF